MAASLLTRIARAADPSFTERQTSRESDVEGAVALHLHQMLNTRKGSCLTCPDYGLAAISDLLDAFPDAIGILQRSIKHTVQTYETRLQNVQVRLLQGDAVPAVALRFEITGQLHLPDGRKRTLGFSAVIDPSGNVKLERAP